MSFLTIYLISVIACIISGFIFYSYDKIERKEITNGFVCFYVIGMLTPIFNFALAAAATLVALILLPDAISHIWPWFSKSIYRE